MRNHLKKQMNKQRRKCTAFPKQLMLLLLLAFTLVFTGCGGGNNGTASRAEDANNTADAGIKTTRTDSNGAIQVQLKGNAVVCDSNNVAYQKNTLYILSGGVYELTGDLKDSTLEINAEKKDTIRLILKDVTLENESGPAIYVRQAGSVILETAEGTVNTLTMGSKSSDEKADGTIYSKDDLTLTGAGTLVVTTQYKHAIVCNDTMVVESGTYRIEAVEDGIHVNDALELYGGALELQVGDDALHVKNDDGLGTLHITDGDIYIGDCYEGLEAHEIVLDGGTVFISAKDDGINACGDRTASVVINDGDITIVHEEGRDGDGVDSNGTITMNGGVLRISMNDVTQSYALDCDGSCTLNGGTVLACGSAGMAECFDENATQGFLQKNLQAGANTKVVLKDMQGKVLLEESVPYAFSNMVLTTPELQLNEKYILQVGDTTEEIVIDNSVTGARMGGGFGGNRGEKPEGDFSGDRGERPQMDGNPPEGWQNPPKGGRELPEDFRDRYQKGNRNDDGEPAKLTEN